MFLTDDYFSDVNPRSMRRLMNVIYVMGRLLKVLYSSGLGMFGFFSDRLVSHRQFSTRLVVQKTKFCSFSEISVCPRKLKSLTTMKAWTITKSVTIIIWSKWKKKLNSMKIHSLITVSSRNAANDHKTVNKGETVKYSEMFNHRENVKPIIDYIN